MKKTNATVAGRLGLHRAQAALDVAQLEAKLNTQPVLTGTSNTRLRLSRQLTEARSQLDTWEYLVRSLDSVDAPVKGV